MTSGLYLQVSAFLCVDVILVNFCHISVLAFHIVILASVGAEGGDDVLLGNMEMFERQ